MVIRGLILTRLSRDAEWFPDNSSEAMTLPELGTSTGPALVPHHITALVLAGGAGKRIGGQDKGLILYRGRPLIANVLERLEPQVGHLLISANRNLVRYQGFGWPVIEDGDGGQQGPLAGLARGLEVARTPWLLSVPCDGPCLPPDLATTLAGALASEGAEIAVANDGERRHYTYALMATSLVGDLQRRLAAGERRLGRWLERHRLADADFSGRPGAFRNLNHPADFLSAGCE